MAALPRGRVLSLTAVVVGVLALGSVGAAAASLGGLHVSNLTAFSQVVTISPPLPLGFDDFSNCRGDLDGTVDTVGNVWQVDRGSFQCQGQWVRSQNRTAWAAAAIDVGVSDGIVVSAAVSELMNETRGRGVGVAVLSNGTSFAAGVYDRDRDVVELVAFSGSTATVLASAAAPDAASASIAVTIQSGTLTLSLDGVDLATAPVPAGWETRTRHGLASDNDNRARFESFRIELLP